MHRALLEFAGTTEKSPDGASVGIAYGIVRPAEVRVRDQMPVAKMGGRTQPDGRST
jgi:hypothetical protein